MWLRVADPEWEDPLDPHWARRTGGRWNPPDSFPVLYLNAGVTTARLRLQRMLVGLPVSVDDLADDAYVLVAATLPRSQTVADLLAPEGLVQIGLPAGYPLDAEGVEVPRDSCRPIGAAVEGEGLRGVLCPSAATRDASGTELAWFPATARSRAGAVWDRPLDLAAWRHARDWADVGLDEQPALR